MARYIDADKMIALVEESRLLTDGFKIVFCALVQGEPTADVQEVRNGEWEHTRDGAALCTACHKKMNPYMYGYAHCPICGAQMSGKGKR